MSGESCPGGEVLRWVSWEENRSGVNVEKGVFGVGNCLKGTVQRVSGGDYLSSNCQWDTVQVGVHGRELSKCEPLRGYLRTEAVQGGILVELSRRDCLGGYLE